MKDDIEFTPRERFLLRYFRDTRLSNWYRRLWLDGCFILISVACLALYLGRNDAGYGVVAYAVLLWRICVSLQRARVYTDDYRSILAKYDAKIAELRATATPSD